MDFNGNWTFFFLYNNAKNMCGSKSGIECVASTIRKDKIPKATKYDVCHTVLTGDNEKK